MFLTCVRAGSRRYTLDASYIPRVSQPNGRRVTQQMGTFNPDVFPHRFHVVQELEADVYSSFVRPVLLLVLCHRKL